MLSVLKLMILVSDLKFLQHRLKHVADFNQNSTEIPSELLFTLHFLCIKYFQMVISVFRKLKYFVSTFGFCLTVLKKEEEEKMKELNAAKQKINGSNDTLLLSEYFFLHLCRSRCVL